ncbi:MAG: hypothetical protein O3C27_10045 [Actinomycetota bacterium]|nr:hypothetical protein [Actinomycetota bacterium]
MTGNTPEHVGVGVDALIGSGFGAAVSAFRPRFGAPCRPLKPVDPPAVPTRLVPSTFVNRGPH